MTDWQPIETAPKDGRPIIVYRPLPNGRGLTVTLARWKHVADGECWVLSHTGGSYATDNDLTHWLPLPQPPEEMR